MWDLIVSVPAHCFSFYFAKSVTRRKKCNTITLNSRRHDLTSAEFCVGKSTLPFTSDVACGVTPRKNWLHLYMK